MTTAFRRQVPQSTPCHEHLRLAQGHIIVLAVMELRFNLCVGWNRVVAVPGVVDPCAGDGEQVASPHGVLFGAKS